MTTIKNTKNAEELHSALAAVGINSPSVQHSDLIFDVAKCLIENGTPTIQDLLNMKLENKTKWGTPPEAPVEPPQMVVDRPQDEPLKREEVKAGEVVQLNGEGTMMVVKEIEEDSATCTWFDDGELCRNVFNKHLLIKVDVKDIPTGPSHES